MIRLYPMMFAFLMLFILSCASKKEDGHDHPEEMTADESDWKEMDEFHFIMAETFHPYKDSANLEPVKSRAAELAEAASDWSSTALPKKVDNDEVKSKLERLKSETATLAENVRMADDDVIAAQLVKVHDTFHEIQEAWYGGH